MNYQVCFTKPGDPVLKVRSVHIPNNTPQDKIKNAVHQEAKRIFGENIMIERMIQGEFPEVEFARQISNL